ncbi:Ankyrin repeat-containing protein At5g02620 [Linum grandiflorum]
MDSVIIPDAHRSGRKEFLSFMDEDLYKAAAVGKLDGLINCGQLLNQLLTPNKNTVLHVYLSAAGQAKSGKDAGFLGKVLDLCPSLLLQINAKNDSLLHIAARYGHEDAVKVLISRAECHGCADLEGCGTTVSKILLRMTNVMNDTALHEAVRNNHIGVVDLLTKEDPDFMYLPNNAGESPLYVAAERGYNDIASHLLKSCTSLLFQGPNGRTSLHAATINGNAELTRMILEWNGGISKDVDQQGWTPLHHASHFAHLSIVKQLLESDKSAAYIQDEDERKTPLHIAAGHGDTHVEIMEVLISNCPDSCEAVDRNGRNALHYAAESYSAKGLKILLSNPFLSAEMINQKDCEGNTPLHLLAASSFPCNILINHPLVDKHAVNNQNSTPLDILSSSDDKLQLLASKIRTKAKLIKAGCKTGQRNKICTEDNSARVEKLNSLVSELKRAQESHLVVATLIATVSFAAGFTMPGGYFSDPGNDKLGTAIFSSKGAFRCFIMADAYALMCSLTAVLIHFMLALQRNKRKYWLLFTVASNFVVVAMVCMVVAFISGTYLVLPPSSPLTQALPLMIGSVFFFFFFIIMGVAFPFSRCSGALRHI